MGMADKDFKTDIKWQHKSNPVYDNSSLNYFFGRISADSWDLVPNPCEQKSQLIHWVTHWKFIPPIKRKTKTPNLCRAPKNWYIDLIFGGISWIGRILVLLFYFFSPWIFHWKHLSSLYRNYRKSIKGLKGEWDISFPPVFISYFLKRRGISVSIIHKQKTWSVLWYLALLKKWNSYLCVLHKLLQTSHSERNISCHPGIILIGFCKYLMTQVWKESVHCLFSS